LNKSYQLYRYLFSGLLIILLLQSCGVLVSYIKTSDVRNNIKKSENKINKGLAKIKSENNINSSLFTQFKDRQFDLTIKPYPKLLKLHNSMLNEEMLYTRQKSKLKKMADNFKIVIHGENEIDEKSPNWKQITEFHDKYKDGYDETGKYYDNFYSKLKEFRSITDDNKIRFAKVTDINNTMDTYNTQLTTRLSKIQGLMSEISDGVIRKHSKEFSSEQLKKVKQMKKQIHEFSVYFSNVKKHINKLLLDMSNDMKGLEYVWTIPESVIRKNLKLVQQDTELLNTKIIKIKKVWESI